ncbi:MAG: tetratricopeptide repeat protein [Dolichospermum sp.]
MQNRIFSILLLTLSLTTIYQLVFARNTVQQLFKQGETAETVGNNSQAETIWRKVLQVEPNNGKAYNNLGNALGRQGKLPEALAAHQKALQLNPNDAEAYVGIGNVLNAQGKPEEALAFYKKALQLNPKLAVAYYNLGNALYGQKKLDAAVAAFQKAIEFDPKDAMLATTYYNLGIALSDQKKLDEAVTAYRKAIELDPKYANAYYNLGIALRGQKKLEQAVAAYQKAIELDPKDATAYNNLGNALRGQKKLEQAISKYKTALSLPENTSTTPTTVHTLANNNLGLALQNQEKFKEAIKHFDKAEGLDPNYIYARNNNIQARKLWTEKQNKLASVDSDIEFLPKNDPNLPIKRSVVRITAQFSNSQRQGTEVGTGVVIQRDANRILILTNRHVIFDGNEQGENIQVEFFSSPPTGKVRMRRNAKLLKMTPTDELDLAVLEITDKLPADIQPLSMSTTINPAMPIQIIGHDAQRGEDKSWSVQSGKINYQNQQLQISATALKPGYSGSPVIDSKNRLIGIVYARKTGETQNFAYPISVVKKQLSIWKITLSN